MLIPNSMSGVVSSLGSPWNLSWLWPLIVFFSNQVSMGYPRNEVGDSVRNQKFDDAYASYLLLAKKSSDVSFYLITQRKAYSSQSNSRSISSLEALVVAKVVWQKIINRMDLEFDSHKEQGVYSDGQLFQRKSSL